MPKSKKKAPPAVQAPPAVDPRQLDFSDPVGFALDCAAELIFGEKEAAAQVTHAVTEGTADDGTEDTQDEGTQAAAPSGSGQHLHIDLGGLFRKPKRKPVAGAGTVTAAGTPAKTEESEAGSAA